jgi:succinoglycan biosynthesis protein ExoA
MAVKDAEAVLAGALDTVLAQTRPADEILIVVASTSGATRRIAENLTSRAAGIRVLGNPAGDRASGINAALAETHADVIALVDGQARLEPDYLRRAIDALERTAAGVVGGPMKPVGRTFVGQAIAAALSSPFGIGNSRFDTLDRTPRPVDAVNLGIYRATTFKAVGGFNSGLLRTEDDDMFARVRQEGIGIYLDPSIRSTYLCRSRFGELWTQFYGYGYWKVALATLRPEAIRLRHVAPAALVIALGAAAVGSVVWRPTLALVAGSYAGAAVVATARARARSPQARLLVPIAMAIMHLAYGVGTVRALLRWRRLRAAARAGEQALSSRRTSGSR